MQNLQKKNPYYINMSNIEKINQLRLSTGAGFKDCSAAIEESSGDLDKAVEILRIKGISKASKKMSRQAKEGVVALSGDENKISLIDVNCETDFVAKNDDFVNFVKEISDINNLINSNTFDDFSKQEYTNVISRYINNGYVNNIVFMQDNNFLIYPELFFLFQHIYHQNFYFFSSH